ncbi:uncharacterized protein [Miscanthus floridulus]|uniref:uncharacterized protein n=1 Tax=Miscanthus floridulus TaxID=154761 RepID=UPI003459B456
MVLIDIRNMLQSMGKDIRSFPLLDIDHSYDDASHIPREIFEEASIEQNPEDVLLCDSLNAEQRSTYDEIMVVVYSKQGGLFFVDEPSGMGKTFLYRALLAKLRSQDKLAVATATSGVAASIMPSWRRTHSRFKIPLTVEEGGCCSFTKQNDYLLRIGGGTKEVNEDGNDGETVYHNFDSVVDDPYNYYPSEFLNSPTPNGLPPHVLKLKLGCPVILLRNIDLANGLCNGTRLVVRGFRRNTIDTKIVVGQHVGKRVFLPRISLCPFDDEMFPFQFNRKQFPIRLSFVMTVSKS